MSKILLMLAGGFIFAFASVAVPFDANAADVAVPGRTNTGLRRIIDIARTSSDAVPTAANCTTFAHGPAPMAFLVRPYTAPMALTAASVIGVVIPTTAGATTAELCAAQRTVTFVLRKLPFAGTALKVRALAL